MDVKQNTYELAKSFLNKPYKWGGKNPVKGMDCSGLVCELLQSLGMIKYNEELNAQNLYDKFKVFALDSKTVPEFGTLVFFGKDSKSIDHVGFALNGTQMIEAGGGTSATLNEEIAEKTNAYVKIRPYKYRSDFFVIIHPNYLWG